MNEIGAPPNPPSPSGRGDFTFLLGEEPGEDVTPLDNFWALDFGLEASRPFLSIRIQRFGSKHRTKRPVGQWPLPGFEQGCGLNN